MARIQKVRFDCPTRDGDPFRGVEGYRVEGAPGLIVHRRIDGKPGGGFTLARGEWRVTHERSGMGFGALGHAARREDAIRIAGAMAATGIDWTQGVRALFRRGSQILAARIIDAREARGCPFDGTFRTTRSDLAEFYAADPHGTGVGRAGMLALG